MVLLICDVMTQDIVLLVIRPKLLLHF